MPSKYGHVRIVHSLLLAVEGVEDVVEGDA